MCVVMCVVMKILFKMAGTVLPIPALHDRSGLYFIMCVLLHLYCVCVVYVLYVCVLCYVLFVVMKNSN